MDYQKIYENLIEKAKFECRKKGEGIYYENHHILPRCLNGGNEKENLVLLTAREHFMAHKLLTCIYPNNKKVALSVHYMIYGNNNYNITARDYQNSKELILLTSSPLSEETKKKISKSEKGKIVSIKTREKISKANTGKRFSKEVNRKKDVEEKKIIGLINNTMKKQKIKYVLHY